MTSSKYRVGIAGAGWIGLSAQKDVLRSRPASHAEAISMDPRLDFVACFDTSEASLMQAKQFYPFLKTYSSFSEFLERSSLDILVISSPAHHHVELICEAASKNMKMILCEKPLGMNSAECEKAIKACESAHVSLVVNHMRRYDPALIDLRSYLSNDYVRDTYLGKTVAGSAFYDKGLFHCGTHILDLLCFFLGDPKAVSAVASSHPCSEKDDVCVDGVLQFPGVNITIQAFNSQEYSLGEVYFWAQGGAVALRNMWGQEIEIVGTRSCDDVSAYRTLNWERTRRIGQARSFLQGTWNHVVDLMNKEIYHVDRDAYKVVKIMEALKLSSEKKGVLVNVQF